GERGEALPVAGRARSAGGRIVSRAGPLELGSEAADGGEQPGCEVVGAAGEEAVGGHPVELGVGVGLEGGHRASWAVWWWQGTASLLSGSSRQPVSLQAGHACPWMTRRCRSARARAAAWMPASGSLCPLAAGWRPLTAPDWPLEGPRTRSASFSGVRVGS